MVNQAASVESVHGGSGKAKKKIDIRFTFSISNISSAATFLSLDLQIDRCGFYNVHADPIYINPMACSLIFSTMRIC